MSQSQYVDYLGRRSTAPRSELVDGVCFDVVEPAAALRCHSRMTYHVSIPQDRIIRLKRRTKIRGKKNVIRNAKLALELQIEAIRDGCDG